MEGKKKKISPDVYAFMRELIQESLRDWFKKEDWVRIASDGSIAGPCGTSKNKKNPDRCLPRAKAQSLTKGQRAATAAKKKKAGAKGKTVVKNTKKATVKKENINMDTRAEAIKLKADLKQLKVNHVSAMKRVVDKRGWENPGAVYYRVDFTLKGNEDRATKEEHIEVLKNLNVPEGWSIFWWSPRMYFFKGQDGPTPLQWITSKDLDSTAEPIREEYKPIKRKIKKEDLKNLVVGTIAEMQQNENLLQEDDRCTRIAKQKYDTWPSAYASGAVVRCRRGEIWKDEK